MSDDKFEAPATFKGLSRSDLIRARSRLMSNTEFQKAVAAGEMEALDAIKDLSQALLETGSGTLTVDEHKITPFSAAEAQ